ncbi:MAG: EF-P lysine aminoacylase EpmA [Halothiobacillaceae bacterium]
MLRPCDWQPGASFDALAARARMLRGIRAFFTARGVLEVETPLLARAASTDVHLESLRVSDRRGEVGFLHTSPEFFMKRLLAAGSGPIYQVSKVFRGGEVGRWHNPEFTLLEWYRPGFSLDALMDEVEALVRALAQDMPSRPGISRRIGYREVFIEHIGVDPWATDVETLMSCARTHGLDVEHAEHFSLDDWLDLLFAGALAPRLPSDALTFIHGFPPSQAALAKRMMRDGREVAARFELFWGELELANGFDELQDAQEQERRFAADNAERERRGLPTMPPDDRLVEALRAGLPACAGVAVGLDRLLARLLGAAGLDEVLAFDIHRI